MLIGKTTKDRRRDKHRWRRRFVLWKRLSDGRLAVLCFVRTRWAHGLGRHARYTYERWQALN